MIAIYLIRHPTDTSANKYQFEQLRPDCFYTATGSHLVKWLCLFPQLQLAVHSVRCVYRRDSVPWEISSQANCLVSVPNRLSGLNFWTHRNVFNKKIIVCPCLLKFYFKFHIGNNEIHEKKSEYTGNNACKHTHESLHHLAQMDWLTDGTIIGFSLILKTYLEYVS